jgi:2-furoate---CoA ligase
MRRGNSVRSAIVLDLGTSFFASVDRDPKAPAIVDGDVRLTYRQWYAKISALVAAFDQIGLKPGDHLITVLQNRWEAATIHWACQFAGIIVTPLNWRAKDHEIDFCIANAEATAIVYQDISAAAAAAAPQAKHLPRIAVAAPGSSDLDFAGLVESKAADATPRVRADAWSLMLYTSGTTSRPKGVPRRHLAERAAAVAHVAQNLYHRGERTLGVMPLYHTMGVRSLLAMSLIGGTFVCLPQFDVARALQLIAAERITNLYLVPTLYHDLVHHPLFARTDISSVRKLGFAGAPMTDALLKELNATFRPDLFVNHYGSSEIYTFTIEQNATAKPGAAGRAGINQLIRVVRLGAKSADEIAAVGEEGEIVALIAGDESFEGYWRRPDADAAAPSRRLVLYRRHRLDRRRRRSVCHWPGRRHDHHRRRERLAGGNRELSVAASRGIRGRRGRGAARALGQDRLRLHPAARRGHRAGARRLLPQLRPRQLQASAPLCLRRGNSQISGRQAFAPQARGRRISD